MKMFFEILDYCHQLKNNCFIYAFCPLLIVKQISWEKHQPFFAVTSSPWFFHQYQVICEQLFTSNHAPQKTSHIGTVFILFLGHLKQPSQMPW